MTPVSTNAPTNTNKPAKKNIASHSIFESTLAIIDSFCVHAISNSKPAPVNAHVADSKPSVPCITNNEIVTAKTNKHFFNSVGSFICAFSSRLMTLSCSSGCVCNSLPYSSKRIPIVTKKMKIAGSVKFKTKSAKFKPTAEPIIIFGGSPINVAVPPMFEDKI